MEANGLLGKSLAAGWKIQSAWIEIQLHEVENISFQVRTRMLDFLLQIKGELGEGGSQEEMVTKAKKIDAAGMFAHAVFGSNITVVLGDGNTTTVTNAIAQGDFASLAKALKQIGVPDEDINTLKASVEQDAASLGESRQIGPAVKSWLGNVWSKAVDSSWAIEMGIAGNLLTDLLKKFYGL